MKAIFKWFVIIITIFIFLYAFSASYSTQNIDGLDYVIALGVDTLENSDAIQVSFQFLNFPPSSNEASSGDAKPIINTVEAPSIESAINIMNAYMGKQLNLSHCKVIVFSEDLARKGLLDETSYLMNNIQVRPTANVIISKSKASSYLENSTASLEKQLIKYFDIFPNSSEYTGYVSNILLGEFYENMLNDEIGTVAILGNISKNEQESSQNSNSNSSSSSDSSSGNGENSNSSSGSSEQSSSSEILAKNIFENDIYSEKITITGDRGTENIGLGVLKKDSFIGELNAEETLCHSLLKCEVDNFVIRVDSPFSEGEKIELSLDVESCNSPRIDTSNFAPTININFKLTGKVLNLLENVDYSNYDTLHKLDDCVNNYLEKLFSSYFYKTSKELKVDIDGFAKYAKKNFKTISDFKNYNWAENYENATFNIDIDSHITSSILIQSN